MPTYPLSGPPVTPNSHTLAVVSNQTVQSSGWTGKTVVINKFSAWRLELTFPPTKGINTRALSAWQAALNGASGTFYFQPSDGIYLQNGGRSLAAISYAGASTVLVSGWGANVSSGLVLGQYIQIADQLHQLVVAPGSSDGSGRCTLEFVPPLRADRGAGTVVNFNSPVGIFRLVAAEGGVAAGYQLTPGGTGGNIANWQPVTAQEAI